MDIVHSVRAVSVTAYHPDLVRETVAEILDQSGLALSGKKVLVKPNLLGPWPPDSAVVTHPSIVRAVREELRLRGCEVLVGDNPGARGYGLVERTAEVSGTRKAAGEDFVNLSLRPRRLPLKSRQAEEVSVCSELEEVDLWISLPKFKTHMTTVITGAIKNSYGLLVGADKARLHAAAPGRDDFGEVLVDIYSLRPPDLVILDAVTGMEGNGPSGGDRREIGYILSSRSGGVIDLAMCHMAGIDPSRVPTQRIAAERGLAPRTIGELDIHGQLPVLKHFKTPSTLSRLDPWGLGQRTVFRHIYRQKIRVDRDACTACGICARACPVGAISMKDHPVIDYGSCISCYCCHELCPERALRVGRMMRFLRREST